MQYWIASFLVVGLASSCRATTIVTLVASRGIVICADGKVTQESNDSRPLPSTGRYNRKLFLIQDRFVVSHGGIRHFHIPDIGNQTKIAFSSKKVIREVQREAAPMFTVARVAEMIRSKLISEFAGFDMLPRSGSLRREHIPPPSDVITDIGVAGYDGESARVYEIAVEMDWKELAHRVTPVKPLHPSQRKNLSLYIMGSSSGISELQNPNSATFRDARTTMPTEISALTQDLDLDVPGMIVLARGLVAIEVKRNPAHVGYPFTVMCILKGGEITTQTYQK
jgi:hypothetical protein